MRLIYTGGGYGGFLPDIPARDLTDDEVKRYGEAVLLASGLYAEEGTKGNRGTPGAATALVDEAVIEMDDDVSATAHDEHDWKE